MSTRDTVETHSVSIIVTSLTTYNEFENCKKGRVTSLFISRVNLHNPIIHFACRRTLLYLSRSGWETLCIGWPLLMQSERKRGRKRGRRPERRLRRLKRGGNFFSGCISHRNREGSLRNRFLHFVYALVITKFNELRLSDCSCVGYSFTCTREQNLLNAQLKKKIYSISLPWKKILHMFTIFCYTVIQMGISNI